MISPRTAAGLQALLVTFLWSTSFILTKWIYAAGGVGPLWLSALRYGLAALVLLGYRRAVGGPPLGRSVPWGSGLWWTAAGIGLLNYAVTQGGVNLGLQLLPSTHVALILNLNNTLQVIIFSALLLRESPAGLQWVGMLLGLFGAALFYWPLTSPPGGWWGALPVLVCGVGYALTTILTRRLMRDGAIKALDLTVVSMAVGAAGTAVIAAALEGIPVLNATAALCLAWLAVINTAFAFTLWAHTQKVLAPFESSTLNNTMLVQIALLAWLVLDEPMNGLKLPGLLLVAAGTLLVQIGPRLRLAALTRRA